MIIKEYNYMNMIMLKMCKANLEAKGVNIGQEIKKYNKECVSNELLLIYYHYYQFSINSLLAPTSNATHGIPI